MMKEHEILPEALNKTQLAQQYKITVRTLNFWLEPFENEIGVYRGRMFTPQQVKFIYEKLGYPNDV